MSHMQVSPGEHWYQGKLEFMLSQRGKPLLVHDGHTFGIQYVRKDKKYWQCNLSRKFNCKARVTTTDTGEIIVTNNEHCHTEIRQHLRKDYQRNKVMMNALMNLSTNRFAESLRRQTQTHAALGSLHSIISAHSSSNQSMSATQPVNMCESNVLNLGKNSSLDPPHSHQQQQSNCPHVIREVSVPEEDDDNDSPLDCGMRSAVVAEESSLSKQSASNSNNTINVDNNDWECKNEAMD